MIGPISLILILLLVYPDHLMVKPINIQNDEFQLWTQKYVGINNTQPVLLDNYKVSTVGFPLNDLYRNKRKNLEGKVYRTGGVNSIPTYICNRVVCILGDTKHVNCQTFFKEFSLIDIRYFPLRRKKIFFSF